MQFAAPGNLNLAEEIPKLSDEVDNLQKQITILEPLRKAELTNNLSELKVLQKSKIGLIREINIKELQKQQFIVQENDNSLFGKYASNLISMIMKKWSRICTLLKFKIFLMKIPTSLKPVGLLLEDLVNLRATNI